MEPIANFSIENLRFDIRHRPLKRFFDVLFSLIVLTALMPLLALIALAVKLTSTGPILYSHERVGRGGRLFRCYKFRSMVSDSDSQVENILGSCNYLRNEWLAARKLKNDPRVTPFGRLLRKTSLDELPQFWNVLKGDLSVVGPRPVVMDEVENHFGARAEKILSIRPGITGLWQVSGRSNVSYPMRLQFDEQYVDQNTFLMDLRLILKTIPALIFQSGAY